MDVFTMVAIIVVFGTTTGVITTYLKGRQQRPPEELVERIQKLERRVGELEDAVTNEERELRRRFAELDAAS
ncbi:hypothetical protein [uncultured Abyssibacter sp.]|uniref:hypothetical protein n=1 Tax=uncultured Abyssibacter sp. TaxID=2320202 RepID=UPI0032B30169